MGDTLVALGVAMGRFRIEHGRNGFTWIALELTNTASGKTGLRNAKRGMFFGVC